MHRRFLRAGIAFTLALIGGWYGQMTIKAEEAPINMGNNRNKVLDSTRQQLDAHGAVTLRVRAESGNIRVTAGDNEANGVTLRTEKIIEGNLPVAELNAYLPRIEVNAHQENGDTLAVWADYPREEFARKRINVTVNFTLTVPNHLRLDLLSHSGNVSASGARADVKAHSDSGNATLTDIAGTVEATAHSGDVSLQNATAQKAVLRTDSGNVGFEGDATELDMHASSGNVTGKVTGAHKLSRVALHSNSGNVTLTVPNAFSATIQARTDSGNIRTSGALHAVRSVGGEGRSHRQFTMGDGSAQITLETNSGDVEVSAR
jgi:DUF4097 and DUF4098 domain-containing protein YvlB